IIPINPSRALQFYSLDSNTRHGKKSNIIDKVSRLFSKLDLSGGSTSSKTSSTATQTLNLSTYQRNGFRCTHPRDVEREIHEWLWHKYGKGNVLCEACHKTHHEWVRVPVREMVSIMYTIEGICSRSEHAAATSKRERPEMSTFAEDRFNEQFEQGMIDQFECIRDSELAQGYQYLEDSYYKMCDTCKKQLDAVVEEHPYISDHVRRYSIMLKKRYDHYMGTTAGTAGTA
ncbi:hypothetical protein C6P43_003505, partial [Kluyveromyces marxianus]